MRRRQQVQGDRDAAPGDARRIGQPEQLLQLHRQHRRIAGPVAQPDAGTAGDLEVGRGQCVQPRSLAGVEQTAERRRQVEPLQMLAPGDSVQPRLQPVFQVRGQPRICLLYTSRCV